MREFRDHERIQERVWPGKRYRPEEIISKLRAIEVYFAKGLKSDESVRKEGITEQAYYCWRKQYGG